MLTADFGRTKRVLCLAAALVLGGIGLVLQQTHNVNDTSAYINPLPQKIDGNDLQTTLELKTIDGVQVPYQNGMPVPSFDPQSRRTITLNGEWLKHRFDADHDFSMAPRDEAWLAGLHIKEGQYLTESGADGWEKKQLPMPENELSGVAEANAAETYENGVWYRSAFHLDQAPKGKSYTLKSLGVNYISDYWINGEWVGFHEGGFTPFAFDITPFIHKGDNEIRIRIDNPPWGSRDDIIPAMEGTDFFNYTGVIQDLYVEVADDLHIVRADIVPLAVDGRIKVQVTLFNQGAKARKANLNGEIYEANRESKQYLTSPRASDIKGVPVAADRKITELIEVKAGEARVLTYELGIDNPKLWSMENPNLYIAEFELADADANRTDAIDVLATQFGIRTVKTDKTQILLNDNPVFFGGIARHEEWPDTGRTASWDRILKDLQHIQEQNVNMVRTGHYPNHIYTYLLLDRLGLAAMSEIPLWQFETAQYKAQEKRKFSDQMWREMVFSQYNRPSVLFWSTQNESKDVNLRLAYNRRVVNDLRDHYNDGRLITQSAAADQPGFNDPSMEPLDVAGWTMYFGVFHGSTPYEGTRLFLEKAHEAFPDKPILNTEFGHWTGDGDVEAPKQMEVYQDTLQAMLEKSTLTLNGKANPEGYVAGIDFWIMYDWYVNHNQWIDTFGLFHMNRSEPKPVVEQFSKDYLVINGKNKGLAVEGAPNSKVLWEDGRKGAIPSGGEFHLPLEEYTDLSNFPWLKVEVRNTEFKTSFTLILEDTEGRQWSYQTYEILPYTDYPVYVPLWSAERIDLSHISSLSVVREADRSFTVLRISITDDATPTWTTYSP